MKRMTFRGGLVVLASVAFVVPTVAFAQGDPAPRGGAGANLPAVNGSAAAAAEARLANPVINTPPVTTSPAGAPNTADVRSGMSRTITSEGPASPFEMHRRLEAIRDRRASGNDAPAAGAAWYGDEGGRASVKIRVPQPGPTGGNVPTRGFSEAGGCMDVYVQMWGPAENWHPQVLAGLSECADGSWSRAYAAWDNWYSLYSEPAPGARNRYRRRFWDPGSFDPQMYWGSPHASGMGYSQRSGGFSRAYADAGLKLDVTPTDARVYVDGYYAGQVADFDGQIRRLPLNPGAHRVEFVANGLEPLVISAEVPEGQMVTFTGQLTRKK